MWFTDWLCYFSTKANYLLLFLKNFIHTLNYMSTLVPFKKNQINLS